MKITYDPSVDALYIYFNENAGQVMNQHWADGIVADFDKDDHLAGIEILDASKVIKDLEALKHLTYKEYAPRLD